MASPTKKDKQMSFQADFWNTADKSLAEGKVRGVSLFAGAGGMDVGFEAAGVHRHSRHREQTCDHRLKTSSQLRTEHDYSSFVTNTKL